MSPSVVPGISAGFSTIATTTTSGTNALLRTPNMVELRKVADEFDCLIVVDESIGNFVNVDIMEYTDIVATSLTEAFLEGLV